MTEELDALRNEVAFLRARLAMTEAVSLTLAKIAAGNDPSFFMDLIDEQVEEVAKAQPDLRAALVEAAEYCKDFVAPDWKEDKC